jgi:hypothetical protein
VHQPASAGFPEGPLGQPFYGWLSEISKNVKARFQRASQTAALAPFHTQENLHASVNIPPRPAAKAMVREAR